MKFNFFLLLCSVQLFSQEKFEQFFLDKSLRLDYFHTGNSDTEIYSIDESIEESYWGGSKLNLIDPFNYGKYKIIVYDFASDEVIFSKTYSTLFSEWQTTEEAKATFRTFSETIVMPYPKNKVRIEFYNRNRKNELVKKFGYTIDPKDDFIKRERISEYDTFKVFSSGLSSEKVDIVFLPDGYTKNQMALFKKDCKKFVDYFFQYAPYNSNKDKFNFWGIEAASADSGTDFPSKGIWAKTEFNTNFSTFGTERYLMTNDNKAVRDAASNVPYDQIYVLVNTSQYGGGSIYNYYSVSMHENQYEAQVFIHEFGHGFTSLADEYVTEDVSYQNFYDLSVEPTDPNLTTLVDFNSKWKDLVESETLIPTPETKEYKDKVGAFEGGGYIQKGIYRPMNDCLMRSLKAGKFCKVCERAIQSMIDFYSE